MISGLVEHEYVGFGIVTILSMFFYSMILGPFNSEIKFHEELIDNIITSAKTSYSS